MSESRDGGEDFVGALGTREWGGLRMVRRDEFSNRGLQLCDAAVDTSTELFVGEFGEPALNEIQP